jgi:hypothetical protein
MRIGLRPAAASAVVLLNLWLLTPSRAGTTFILGNNPQPDEENVLFAMDQTGTSVTGVTNQSHIQVLFTSTQTLSVTSKGQASVSAIDSTGMAVALNNITLSVPQGTFTDLIFNPHIGGQPKVDTTIPPIVTVVANEPGGGTQTFMFTYPTTGNGAWGNGNNFLTMLATGGETFESVSISAPGGFNDLQQVRISGIVGGVPGPFVPEPSGLVLAALGVAGFVARARKAAP